MYTLMKLLGHESMATSQRQKPAPHAKPAPPPPKTRSTELFEITSIGRTRWTATAAGKQNRLKPGASALAHPIRPLCASLIIVNIHDGPLCIRYHVVEQQIWKLLLATRASSIAAVLLSRHADACWSYQANARAVARPRPGARCAETRRARRSLSRCGGIHRDRRARHRGAVVQIARHVLVDGDRRLPRQRQRRGSPTSTSA